MNADEVTDGVVTNILASLITCFLIGIEREMPDHSRKARLIVKVEEAILNLKRSTEVQLSEEQTKIGVDLYNKLLKEFQSLLENEIATECELILDPQLLLGAPHDNP